MAMICTRARACVCKLCAGDTRCFLFTVFPTLRVYTTTGYNEHFMYLNHNQQTMPNGLVRLASRLAPQGPQSRRHFCPSRDPAGRGLLLTNGVKYQ